MAKVTMKLEGFEATQKALLRVPDVVRNHASTAINHSAFAIAQRAKALVPVDSGALRIAIEAGTTSRNSLVGRVGLSGGTSVYYWRFVEFGTVRMSARPFFRPAAEAERNNFIARMRNIGPLIERDLSTGRLF